VKSLKGVDRIVVVSRWIAHQGDKEMTWHVSRLFGLSLPGSDGWRIDRRLWHRSRMLLLRTRKIIMRCRFRPPSP